MADWNEEERRRAPRVERVTLVHVKTVEEQGFENDLATGRTLNISAGGVRLELQQTYPLPLRSILGLSVQLENEIVELEGMVIYLQVLDQERCALGVQFTDLSDDVRAKLKKFTQSGAGVSPVLRRAAPVQQKPAAR